MLTYWNRSRLTGKMSKIDLLLSQPPCSCTSCTSAWLMWSVYLHSSCHRLQLASHASSSESWLLLQTKPSWSSRWKHQSCVFAPDTVSDAYLKPSWQLLRLLTTRRSTGELTPSGGTMRVRSWRHVWGRWILARCTQIHPAPWRRLDEQLLNYTFMMFVVNRSKLRNDMRAATSSWFVQENLSNSFINVTIFCFLYRLWQ